MTSFTELLSLIEGLDAFEAHPILYVTGVDYDDLAITGILDEEGCVVGHPSIPWWAVGTQLIPVRPI